MSADENTRLITLYNDDSRPEFGNLVDAWADTLIQYQIDTKLAFDALTLATKFATKQNEWKTLRRLRKIR